MCYGPFLRGQRVVLLWWYVRGIRNSLKCCDIIYGWPLTWFMAGLLMKTFFGKVSSELAGITFDLSISISNVDERPSSLSSLETLQYSSLLIKSILNGCCKSVSVEEKRRISAQIHLKWMLRIGFCGGEYQQLMKNLVSCVLDIHVQGIHVTVHVQIWYYIVFTKHSQGNKYNLG